MEMSEEIYANVEEAADNKADSSDSEQSYEDVYVNGDNLQTQRARSFKQSENSGNNHAEKKCYKLTTVCLLLLSFLLLTSLTIMSIKFSIINTEKAKLETSHKNLTEEKYELQTRYNTLTEDKDQIQTRYNTLTEDKDQIQTRYNTLTEERNQLNKQNDECQKKLTGSGWTLFQSSFYYVSTEMKNWTESREDCRKRGADLVIINSKEEQSFVEKLNKKPGYFIGLSDRDTEGTWKWVDGTALITSYWSDGNVFSDSEDCVVNGYGGNTGWYDRPCSEKYYWICE